MDSTPLETPASPRTRWPIAAVYGLLGAVIVTLLVMAFVWPAATSQAKNLPVGVSGSAEQLTALEDALAEQDPSPFALVPVSSRDDAVADIESREIYGAILLDAEGGPEVLTASAGSPIAAQALRGVASGLQAQISAGVQEGLLAQLAQLGQALATGGSPATPPTGASPEIPAVVVTDVVPLADSDATGAGLTAAGFPMVLGGMLGGILISLLVAGAVRRLMALAAFAVVAGVTVTLVMQTWFGILQGSWLHNAAAVGLGMAATSALIIGLNALIGPPGIGVGAVITMLIANPIAAAASPLEFLPEPWGAIGQFFVPGASAHLIRSLSYFPDAATAMQWLVLAAWTLLGVVLALVGHFRDKPDVPLPAAQLEAQPTA